MLVSKEEFIKLIIEQFADKVSTKDAELIVNGVVKALIECMKKGKVKIYRFGSFSAWVRPARNGRNPRTGEAIKISAKVIVKFKPSPNLKEMLASSLMKKTTAKAPVAKKAVPTKKATPKKK